MSFTALCKLICPIQDMNLAKLLLVISYFFDNFILYSTQHSEASISGGFKLGPTENRTHDKLSAVEAQRQAV